MLREYLKSLADKFREKFEMSEIELLNAQDFPDLIDEVYEAGKQAGGDSSDDTKFWDMLTDYGTRTVYTYGFQYCNLGNSYFFPSHDIKPTEAIAMFARTKGNFDLVECFAKNGKTLSFSNCTALQQLFYLSKVKKIGICDFTKATNLYAVFGNCSNLEEIVEIKFSKEMNYAITNMFLNCGKLTKVIASGSFAISGLDLSACPLTRASKLSFLNILEPTSTTKTIIFGAGESLTNEDVAIGTQKGWSVIV